MDANKRDKIVKWVIRIMWAGLIFGFLFIFIVIGLIASGNLGFIPPFDELENPKSSLASEVISSDGQVLGKYYVENRTIVHFDSLSPNIINALLATEDIRFYKHSGIDMRSLARVLVKSILLGKSAGGGSTITQQLAKNLYRMREKLKIPPKNLISKIWRIIIMKFQEWVTAAKLEKNYTKEEILVMYLNTVPFGHNAYGINSASYIFFGKSPNSLKLEEAAVLVGLLRAPTKYSPILHPENSIKRRNTVISQIQKYQKELHKITGWKIKPASYFDSLRALPLKISYHKETHNEGIATYFREYLRLYLTAKKPQWKDYPKWNKQKFYDDSLKWVTDPFYGWCNKNHKPDGTPYDIYRDGLRIYVTINSRMQLYAEQAVAEHMKELQALFYKRINTRYRKGSPFDPRLSKKDIEKIMYNSMRRSARWADMKRSGKTDKEIIDVFKNKKFKMKVFSWNGDIDTFMTPYDSIMYYKKILRAGLVSIEPQTGKIRAYVGGIDFNYFKYDHVSLSRRQVGSTFKPFVYTLAMMPGGYSPCYKVPNVPVTINVEENGKKKPYTPKFSKSKFDGQMITLKMGLALSLNQISAWVMKQYKPENVIKLVRKMGITSPLEPVYSLCVGSGEVTLLEMTSAYCTYANKGIHVDPIFIEKIEDRYGNILATSVPKKTQVIDENTAYRVLSLMKGVVEFGTAARLRYKYGFTNYENIAGKTGTTNNNSDGWFIGITPHLVTGVWVGGEERSVRFLSTALGQGASMALPIWAYYMKKVYADPSLPYKPTDKFEKPTVDDGIPVDCDKENENNTYNQNEIFTDEEF